MSLREEDEVQSLLRKKKFLTSIFVDVNVFNFVE